MDDDDTRARLAKLGRARVEDELAWAHQERAYVGVYERLTGGAGSGGRETEPCAESPGATSRQTGASWPTS